MPKTELTTQQRNIYLFINQYRGEHGYSPSRNEIAENTRIHPSTVRAHLSAIKQKDYITWDERVFRSITVTKQVT
jgi:SOS-response transcriptional repressor LexA